MKELPTSHSINPKQTVALNYYTDGSAIPNPGQGGYAVIKNGRPYLIGAEPNHSDIPSSQTTNIRMEGLAIMAALDDAAGQPCIITTDSQFWINVLEKWAHGWVKNGWVKKSGPIKNLDIVKELYAKYQKNPNAKLVWTKGHVGTKLNELADQWANKARQLKLSNKKIIR